MAKKSSHSAKLLVIALVLVGGAAAGFGYFKQSIVLQESTEATTEATTGAAAQAEPDPNHVLFTVKSDDIVLGNADAPNTIIEYASLGCPHCAHFHVEELPKLQKQYIDTGKAKFVMRYFPLNEPALRAAQLVECAEPEQRANFIKTLFETQKDWAFSDAFLDDLKRIAKVGGIDSASFDSCMADKALETRIVQSRHDGTKIARVHSTPSFFINGVRVGGTGHLEDFQKILDASK